VSSEIIISSIEFKVNCFVTGDFVSLSAVGVLEKLKLKGC
jgi:hypothetical protein